MPLTGTQIIHVKGYTVAPYSYRRRFSVKDKPEKAPSPPKRIKLPKTLRRVKGSKRVAFIGPQRP